MASLVQDVQPSEFFVMSMIQFGARNGAAEAMNVSQSARFRGEKSFVPVGQLFLSLAL
jgi:hypothetical protein